MAARKMITVIAAVMSIHAHTACSSIQKLRFACLDRIFKSDNKGDLQFRCHALLVHNFTKFILISQAFIIGVQLPRLHSPSKGVSVGCLRVRQADAFCLRSRVSKVCPQVGWPLALEFLCNVYHTFCMHRSWPALYQEALSRHRCNRQSAVTCAALCNIYMMQSDTSAPARSQANVFILLCMVP